MLTAVRCADVAAPLHVGHIGELPLLFGERCSYALLNAYEANFHIISGHAPRPVQGSQRVWFQRTKVIKLPRHLVTGDLSWIGDEKTSV